MIRIPVGGACLSTCLAIALISCSMQAGADTGESPLGVGSGEELVQLSGERILAVFADVRDQAEVQDAEGTRAVNFWYRDGRFISRWSSATDSGEVVGTWRVESDLRCITISSGLEQRVGRESCSPVYRRGDKYLSTNSDGSIHGVHRVSPLPQ